MTCPQVTLRPIVDNLPPGRDVQPRDSGSPCTTTQKARPSTVPQRMPRTRRALSVPHQPVGRSPLPCSLAQTYGRTRRARGCQRLRSFVIDREEKRCRGPNAPASSRHVVVTRRVVRRAVRPTGRGRRCELQLHAMRHPWKRAGLLSVHRFIQLPGASLSQVQVVTHGPAVDSTHLGRVASLGQDGHHAVATWQARRLDLTESRSHHVHPIPTRRAERP